MNGYKLLVIDDNPTSRDDLVSHFLRKGWEVSLATTLDRGLTVLSQCSPDWIIVASELPGGSGQVILRAVRVGNRRSRVAILTEASGSPRYASVVGHQPDLLLTRPVNPEEVYDRCEAGIGSSVQN